MSATSSVSENFWEDLIVAVRTNEVSAEDAKIGLGTMGLMLEVTSPNRRTPKPIDTMVDDVIKAALGDTISANAEENAMRVAEFVRHVSATNPLLKKFGAALQQAWEAAEKKRQTLAKLAIGGTAATNAPASGPRPAGTLSPLAARLVNMKK